LGNYILVVGGGPQGQAFLFDIENFKWLKPNQPEFFVSEAASASNGTTVYIHGGRNERDNIQSQVLYRVTIKPGTPASPRNEPFEVDMVGKDDMDMWRLNNWRTPSSVKDWVLPA
jgi:hypothetical protein